MLRQIVTSSMTHFLVLGGLLFWWFPAPESPSNIRVSRSHLQSLYQVRSQELGVPQLTASQQAEVRERWLRDELVYREALRLGLDKEDSIIRQRLVQKAWFLAQELGGASVEPSVQELQQHYQHTLPRWQHPISMRFWHIYAKDHQPDRIKAWRERAVAADHAGPSSLPPWGDSFPLGRDVPLTSAKILERWYGEPFVKALTSVPVGVWTTPLRSRYGWHLVKVLQRTNVRTMLWQEAKDEVRTDWMLLKKRRVEEAFLHQLKQRYRIEEAP